MPSEYIKKIRTTDGDKQIDYESLANLPKINNTELKGNVDVVEINQGSSNSGKFLGIGPDGNVSPMDPPQGMTEEQVAQIEQNKADISSLSEDMNRYGFRSIVFKKENSIYSSNYRLMKYNAAVGDILWFNNISNRKVNVLATYTDGSKAILINNLEVSELEFITVEKDIQYFGLYLYDYDVLPANENVIVNIFNDNTYKKIYNHKNTEDIAKNTEDIRILKANKVTGVPGWNGSRYEKIDTYVYRRDGFLHNQSDGNYSYAELIPTDTKVRISGFGWGYSYDFRLYYFYDSSGSIILESDETYASKSVIDLEIDIPEGSTKIVVNGRADHPSKIEIYGNVTSFEACYQAMKDTEPREPIKYFKLITLGDSITMLGTGERGWIK